METIHVVQLQRLWLWLGAAGLCIAVSVLKLGGWIWEVPGFERERSLGWLGIGIGALMLIYAFGFAVIGYELGKRIGICRVLSRQWLDWDEIAAIKLDKRIVRIKGVPLPEFFLFLRLVGGKSVQLKIPREHLHAVCMMAEDHDKPVEQLDWAVLEAARLLVPRDAETAKEHLRQIVRQHPGTFLAKEAASLLSVIR